MQGTQPSLQPKYLQENELTQESKDLISTLPKEKGSIASHLYQYQGFWHPSRQLQGVLACQKHFKAIDTDTFLVTTPKSSTTWLKAVTFSLLNRKKYQNYQNRPLLNSNPYDLVPFLELKLFIEKDVLPNLASFSSPRLFSTHLPYVSLPKSAKESNYKIVYLCRDPKDIFVSLWNFANKLRPVNKGTNPFEESFDKFCRGVNLCGPYWDHVLGYWKEFLKNPKKILFLKYEDLKMHEGDILKKIVEFLGCAFSKEEEEKRLVDDVVKLCSFDNLSRLEVNKSGKLSSGVENSAFFDQGEVGDWKKHLTIEKIEKINFITKQKLGKHRLGF